MLRQLTAKKYIYKYIHYHLKTKISIHGLEQKQHKMAEIEIFSSPEPVTAADHPSSSSSSSSVDYGGRAIDRHNPIIRDNKRTPNLSSSPSYLPHPPPNNNHRRWHQHLQLHFFSKKKESDILQPGLHGSTRFLLNSDTLSSDSEIAFDSALPVSDPLRPSEQPGVHAAQVVVLRVSLHCKGCEGKLRKHISRMRGVTSFSIDFSEKKVTVVGDVTPLSVLASVSKVKKAQIWTPMAPTQQST